MHALTSLHQTITATLNEHQDNLILLCATVGSAVRSDWHHRKHQSCASLALCEGNPTGDRWIPLAKGQQCVSISWRHHAASCIAILTPVEKMYSFWFIYRFGAVHVFENIHCKRQAFITVILPITWPFVPWWRKRGKDQVLHGLFYFQIMPEDSLFCTNKTTKTLAFMKQSLQNLAPNCLTHFKVSFISMCLGPQVQTHCSWK